MILSRGGIESFNAIEFDAGGGGRVGGQFGKGGFAPRLRLLRAAEQFVQQCDLLIRFGKAHAQRRRGSLLPRFSTQRNPA